MDIGSESYAVTGVIARKGRQLLGTLTTTLGSKEIPFNFRISNSGSSFFSIGTSWFQSPIEESIALLAVGTGFNSFTEDLEEIVITNTPIEVDGDASFLSLELTEITQASLISGLENAAQDQRIRSEGVLTPLRVNEVGNHLDHFASLLSIGRTHKETNEQLLARIENKIAFGSGSSEKGLSEAIANTFSLTNEDGVLIKIRETTVNPKNEIGFSLSKSELVLYREAYLLEVQNTGSVPVVEMRIDLRGLSLATLVYQINLSENFQAELLADSELPSDFLVPVHGVKLAIEELTLSEKMYFANKNILKGMLSIDAPLDLVRQVQTSNELVRKGDYLINYEQAYIQAFRTPSNRVRISYLYNTSETVIRLSRVYLLPLNLESSNEIHFEQMNKEFYSNEIEKQVNGFPTDMGYNSIRNVMTAGKFPQFWGE
jgi:hypothetical protein